ncbi:MULTISPECIES: CU044_2847 family protein [Mycobacterium]|uniref:CU044_2847 family protein n=1 Tax=Mycobacterium TaxID=1763 RepID=UPI00115119EF|nr:MULTISPECIES: CU044_2847 family protein [Mycobacterium]
MAEGNSTSTLTLVVASEEQVTRELEPGESEEQGFVEWTRRKLARKQEVQLDEVKKQLNEIQGQLDSLLASLPNPKDGPFRLNEVEVGLSISAEGGIGIATVGGEISLSLTFARKE